MKRYASPAALRLQRTVTQIAALALLALASAPDANSACGPVSGTVVCIGATPDGFQATEDGLTIQVVDNADVGNGGVEAQSAILALDDSTISVERGGEINSSGNRGRGLTGGNATDIQNSGDITASGTDGIGVDLGSASQFLNDGTISATGPGGIGVFLHEDSVFLNDTGGSVFGAGQAVQGNADTNTIRNAGTINGSVNLRAGDDTFLAFGSLDRFGNDLLNGAIDGGPGLDQLALTDGLNVSRQHKLDLDTVTNFEALDVSGSGAHEWELSGSTDFPGGAIIGSGALRFAPGTSLDSSLAVVGGVVTVTNDVEFTQGLSILGGGVSFEDGADVSGTVSMTSGVATVSDNVLFRDLVTVFDNGVLILNDGAAVVAQGDLDASGGILALNGDASLDGRLFLDTPATFLSAIGSDGSSFQLDVVGGRIRIDESRLVLSRLDAGNLGAAKTYTILTATGGIVGQFRSLEFAGGADGFLAASIEYGPAIGQSSVRVTTEVSYIAPARSANQLAVGIHLDSANQLTASTEFQGFLDALTLLDTTGAIDALNALHPEFFDVHTSAALATGSAFADLLATRPIRCERYVSPYRPSHPSREACGPKGFRAWVSSFGRIAERQGRPGFRDWTFGGGGVAVGLDRKIGDSFIASGMLGGSRIAMDFDGDGDGSASSFDFGFALAWQREATHVRGVFEYGHTWHDTRRQVEYPGFSQLNVSDHESDRFTLLVEAGHEFLFGPIEVEPLASFAYTYLHEGSINETRYNQSALSIDSRENVLVTTEVGVRVGLTLVKYGWAGQLLEWADGVWRPEIRGGWRQVLNDYDRATSARFRSAPAGAPKFRTQSEDAQYGAELAAGLSFQPQGVRTTVHVGYEAFVGNRTLIHSLMAAVKIPF